MLTSLKKRLVVVAAAAIGVLQTASPAFAGISPELTIRHVAYDSLRDRVFIDFEGPDSAWLDATPDGNVTPDCGGGYVQVLGQGAKEIMSVALAAQLSGRPVRIWLDGTCGFANHPILRTIQMQ